MTGRVFRINKLGGKPYRVTSGGCTLSLNFRTETAASRFLLRSARYEHLDDEALAAVLRETTGVEERDSIRMELRARSDLRKYAEGSGKPTT